MSVLVRFACDDNDVESVIGLYEDSESPAPPLCPAISCAGIATSSDELTGTEEKMRTAQVLALLLLHLFLPVLLLRHRNIANFLCSAGFCIYFRWLNKIVGYLTRLFLYEFRVMCCVNDNVRRIVLPFSPPSGWCSYLLGLPPLGGAALSLSSSHLLGCGGFFSSSSGEVMLSLPPPPPPLEWCC